jgi:hypothetical protein
MEINDFEIAWLYILDSGRWINKREELKTIAEELYKKTSVTEGIIRYFTMDDLEEHAKAGKKMKYKAVFEYKDEKIREILDLFYSSDMDNIDPEYLESLQIFRAKLTSFEIYLPNDRVEPVEVRVLFHNSGILILEFWLKLKNMALTPEIINEIQLFPREELNLTFNVPRKLLKDYAQINRDIADFLGNEPETEENKMVKLELTLHELVWMYWAVIAHVATNRKAKTSTELLHSLRYNAFRYFPVLIFNFPEISNPKELLEKYKRELYTMLYQEIYLKPEHLREDFVDNAFEDSNNLADRADYLLYFSMESCLYIYTQQSKSALEHIAKKMEKTPEQLLTLEKLELILVLTLLNLRRFLLMIYDFLLSRRPISEMETDELTGMRGILSKGVEEFYDMKLLVKTGSIKRLEKGRDFFEIDKALDVIEKKMDLIDSAVSGIHNNLMEFLSVVLGILVQIGPIIALSIGESFPVIAASVSIAIFFGIYFIYGKLYRIWYRRRKIK